jgi:hypothetical protein
VKTRSTILRVVAVTCVTLIAATITLATSAPAQADSPSSDVDSRAEPPSDEVVLTATTAGELLTVTGADPECAADAVLILQPDLVTFE